MKMKLFSSFTMTKADIEARINAWLERYPEIKILDIKQSGYSSFWGASTLFITVWYEASGKVTQKGQ